MSFPPASAAFPEASQATTALVLGILGIICCQPLGIFAWVMANNELTAIRSGLRNPENHGLATAARVLGIIGTAFLAIGVVVAIVAITGAFAFNREVVFP
jgi:TRAP-type C4-dicarboxylate transport system permease small subunit